MGLSRRIFTKEFKLAAVRRLEQPREPHLRLMVLPDWMRPSLTGRTLCSPRVRLQTLDTRSPTRLSTIRERPGDIRLEPEPLVVPRSNSEAISAGRGT